MLDEQLPSECIKLLKAVRKVNDNGNPYPCLTELQPYLSMNKADIMLTAKYLSENNYVHVDYGKGDTIYLIELKFKGKHYLKTRGVENLRFWIPIVISVLALIVSIIALFQTM